MAQHLLRYAPLLALLATAAVTDLRDRRIPNWLVLLVILSGLMRAALPVQSMTFAGALLGMFVGAAIPMVLFAIGALGAGDVKLMAGVGAWLGAVPALVVFALAAVFGMLIVLAQAACQRRLPELFKNSAVLALNVRYVREVGVEHAAQTGRSTTTVRKPLPYAVPVLAAVCAILLKVWR